MFRPMSPTQRLVDVLIAAAYVGLFVLVPVASLGYLGALDMTRVVPPIVFGVGLALRRWSPGLALAVAWAGAVLQMALGIGPDVFDAAIPPVVYACAAYGTRSVRWSSFASALAGAGVAGVYVATTTFAPSVLFSADGVAGAIGEFARTAVLTGALLLLAWTVGLLVRTARQSRRNREDADEAGREAAMEQERTRIARDMHDVVAHSLAVVIAQSDGARLVRRTDPEAVDEALETIGATARAALADVRVLLQQLRYEGTTSVQPGLADLPTLLERFRASGLDVDAELDADAALLGTAAQLAAFRIVQESLTNVLRHGDRARAVAVGLHRTPHGLSLRIESRIDPARPPRPTAGGHGLIGMRERAATVQGELHAGPDGDRFRVEAFLPSTATAAIPVVRAETVR